ncbi:DUF389 domain-containing protein [Arthrobacter sp. R3-55]
MIVQLRICVPAELSEAVLECCSGQTGTAGVAVFKGASVVPAGDLITVQIARESAEELIERLHALKVPDHGSISISTPDLVLSERADQAEKEAPGESADSVIWDEVSTQTGEDSKLTWSFLAFLVIATQLAAIGIVTDSTIAIVGAMVVGPEFGPLAALAGAAGMLSMISHRSSALVGVFISVTTVPAAGYVAVALVLGEYSQAAGSALQLALNLVGIVSAAAAVLLFYRLIGKRVSLPRRPSRSGRRSIASLRAR